MAGQESEVQVAQDGQGKKIRNFAIQTVDANGNVATVYMQGIQVVDESGNLYEVRGPLEEWQTDVLDELRAIRIGIQELLTDGACGREGGMSLPLIDAAREQRGEREHYTP